jgi:hypothetical protein
MLELVTDFVAAANPSQGLVDAIKAYLGPIVLLVIGIFALKFLLNSQIMAFVMFIITAIFVALIFYYPGIIESIASAFYNESGASGW